MLLLAVVGGKASVCNGVDAKLRMRDLERLGNNLPAPKEKNSLDRKPLKKKQSR